MADSVREKILKNLEDTLKNISTLNGYENDIESVQRWKQNGNSLVSVPCVIINAGPEDWTPSPNPLISCEFIVYIDIWIRQDESDTEPTDKLLNSLLADIYKALTQDITRSGNAFDTNIRTVTPFETVEGQPHAGLIIEAVILYRFKQSDPDIPA